MAHFAELDENNNVLRVIVVANENVTDLEGNENEQMGIDFCKGLFGETTIWKQTSYNENFRKNYAGDGYRYDESLDAFVGPKPSESWSLNTETARWESPLEEPTLTQEQIDDGCVYRWDEDMYQADNTTGWVLHDRRQPTPRPESSN